MRSLGKTVYSELRSCMRMPQGYYAVALIMALVLFILFRKERMGKRLAISLLFPYLFLVLGSTLLKRRTMASMRYFLRPFRAHRQMSIPFWKTTETAQIDHLFRPNWSVIPLRLTINSAEFVHWQMNIPTGIMILLFLVLEDRATVGTDSSANARFTKESDAGEYHSFIFAHR